MPAFPTANAQEATSQMSPTRAIVSHIHTPPLPHPAEGEGGPGQGLVEPKPPIASSPPTLAASASSKQTNRDVNLKDSLRYFAAGNVAGMMGVIVGQPFDTLKVRMQTQSQVHSFSASSAAAASAGRSATRNFAAPSFSQPPVFSMGSAGFLPVGAGFSSSSMHVVPSSAAAASPLFSSPLACFTATVRSSGLRGLYRGMSSPLLLVGCQKSVAFGVFGTVVQHLQKQNPLPTLSQVCVAGVAGGVANSLILTPVDQFKISMQIQSYGRAAASSLSTAEALLQTHQQPSMLATARQLVREQGLRKGVYGNFKATLLREVPMYSIYYTLYSYLHRSFVVDHANRSRWIAVASAESSTMLSPTAAGFPGQRTTTSMNLLTDGQKEVLTKLTMGGLTGVGCWATCYPLDTIKVSAKLRWDL